MWTPLPSLGILSIFPVYSGEEGPFSLFPLPCLFPRPSILFLPPVPSSSLEVLYILEMGQGMVEEVPWVSYI